MVDKKVSAKTFTEAIIKAKKYLDEGSEQSLLASTLLSINALEEVLNKFIGIQFNEKLITLYREGNESITNRQSYRGYDVKQILTNIKLRKKATLGEVINHISKYLVFPEKIRFLDSLCKINDSREQIVHNLLITTQITKKSKSHLVKHVTTVVIHCREAIAMAFEILDKSSKIG